MKKKENNNIAGVLLTLMASVGFVLVFLGLSGLTGAGLQNPVLSDSEIIENEIKTFHHLKTIAKAQQTYMQKFQTDGEKGRYAAFYVHLWQSVTPRGETIPVRLIPRALAFAMDASMMKDGYYFRDFHQRRAGNAPPCELDPAREWAVTAQPAAKDQTGRLTFIIDQTGQVYATKQMYTDTVYPPDPLKNGWFKVEGTQDLNQF